MWRYLKAAFWARPPMAWLGRMPANAIGVLGFTILGFGHEGFWLLGAALETAYLYGLTTSERFQRVVDAEDQHVVEDAAADQQKTLIATLSDLRRERVQKIEKKCARIEQLYRDAQTEDFVIDSNREALKKLSWLFLKLLVAQQNLDALQDPSVEQGLQRQLADIQKDLRYDKISPSLRESKQATLQILQKRVTNLDRREQSLEEIESDLTRIEAQIELALENAGMRGKTETISGNIDLVSHLLDDSVYGDSGASIAEIEQTFQTTPENPAPQ